MPRLIGNPPHHLSNGEMVKAGSRNDLAQGDEQPHPAEVFGAVAVGEVAVVACLPALAALQVNSHGVPHYGGKLEDIVQKRLEAFAGARAERAEPAELAGRAWQARRTGARQTGVGGPSSLRHCRWGAPVSLKSSLV